MRWVFCSRAGGEFKGRCVTPVKVATLWQCLFSRRFRAWKRPLTQIGADFGLPYLHKDLHAKLANSAGNHRKVMR
jgi:hypothetical protein